MPAQTPRTSTIALASATLPYIIKLADEGATKACESPEMQQALTCLNGKLTNELTAKALGGA
jgi:alanine dehydrogenase